MTGIFLSWATAYYKTTAISNISCESTRTTPHEPLLVDNASARQNRQRMAFVVSTGILYMSCATPFIL